MFQVLFLKCGILIMSHLYAIKALEFEKKGFIKKSLLKKVLSPFNMLSHKFTKCFYIKS